MNRMKIISDRGRHASWWAGFYAGMRNAELAMARCATHPDVRLHAVQSARKWNREMVRSLREVTP